MTLVNGSNWMKIIPYTLIAYTLRLDEWVIYGLNDFTDVIVKVYNRWGQEVFSSVGYNQPWDGKYNGVDLPTAAYYYVIEINESDKVFNGTVTIKR